MRRRRRPRIPTLLGIEVVLLAGFLVHAAVPGLRPYASGVFGNGVYDAIEILAVLVVAQRAFPDRATRLPWALIAGGLASWTAADVYYGIAFPDRPPVGFTACDVGYLGFYVLLISGFVMLACSHLGARPTLTATLDAVGFALACGAVALLWLEPALDGATGSTATVIVNSAYPILDVLCLAILAGGVTMIGPRLLRWWAPVGLALLILVLADSLYLIGSVQGTYVPGTALDTLWPAGMVLLAAATLRRAPAAGPRRVEAIPATAIVTAAAAFGVAYYGALQHHEAVAVAVALAALAVVIARECAVGIQHARSLRLVAREALIDPLTGLGNRRLLVNDLEVALAAPPADIALVLFDLDEFKRYNDRHGHGAGDAMLEAFGRELSSRFGGRAYRLGGDEFCVLTSVPPDEAAAWCEGLTSLAETGVSASCGGVLVPAGAKTVSEALTRADADLYARKRAHAASAASRRSTLVVSLDPERRSRLVHACEAVRLDPVRAVPRLAVERLKRSHDGPTADVVVLDVGDLPAWAIARRIEIACDLARAASLVAVGAADPESARIAFAAGANAYLGAHAAASEALLAMRLDAVLSTRLTAVPAACQRQAPAPAAGPFSLATTFL